MIQRWHQLIPFCAPSWRACARWLWWTGKPVEAASSCEGFKVVADCPVAAIKAFEVVADWSERERAMGLYQLLEGLLLLANAIAILNEDRFLVKMGLGFNDMASGRVSPFKTQLIGFIHAVQYLRVPLVIANGLVIISKLLFG